MNSKEETIPLLGDPPLFRSGQIVRQWLSGIWARRSSISFGVALSSLFIAFLVVASLFPDVVAPIDPLATDPRHAFAAPSAAHWLGTDENGRDVWSRLIHGARPSLLLGVAASIITSVAGIALGLLAGLGPRLIDNAVMRFVDMQQCVPGIVVALLVVAFWGSSFTTLLFALGVMGIPRYARQVRAQALVVRHAGFVEAATTLGMPSWQIILRHVLPNSVGPALLLTPIEIGMKISSIATLSFLGVGAPPPAPEWGAMLAVDHDYILNAWWLTAIPAATITFTVLAVSALGRDMGRRNAGRV